MKEAILEQRTNGSPSSTAASPTVVRVEDLGCIGIVVRSTKGCVEVAVPSGAATPGMPHADAVEVSSEPVLTVVPVETSLP